MNLYLWHTVDISDHFNNVIQWQKRVALQLSVDILALGAGSQQVYERVVVRQGSILICPLLLRGHHLQQHRERRAVVVEDQHILTCIHQLVGQTEKAQEADTEVYISYLQTFQL